MQHRHGMKLVERADADKAAPSIGPLNRLSCAGALMRGQLDEVIGAARTEPDTWAGARVEDMIATLDDIATMATREADRLREFQGSRRG